MMMTMMTRVIQTALKWDSYFERDEIFLKKKHKKIYTGPFFFFKKSVLVLPFQIIFFGVAHLTLCILDGYNNKNETKKRKRNGYV